MIGPIQGMAWPDHLIVSPVMAERLAPLLDPTLRSTLLVEEKLPMSNKVFLDCLGRQIKVGDVLAYGHRVRNHGAIVLSIVRGFANNAINVTKLERRGYAWRNNLRWEFADNRHITLPDQCFITGLAEEALKTMINLENEAIQ